MNKPNIKTLENIGNSCYMNAVLYALRFTPAFLHNLHHLKQQIEVVGITDQGANDVIKQLHDVFANLSSSGRSGAKKQSNQLQKSVYEMNDIFIPQTQQDSHEFLLFLLNCVRDVSNALTNSVDLLASPNLFESNNNQESEQCFEYFRKSFIGQRSSMTRCLCCETVFSHAEEIIDVFVPIRSGSELKRNFIRDSCVTKERLEEKIKCSECIHLWHSTMAITFPELPRILIVQIGRFDNEAKKVNTVAPILYQLDCFCSKCDGQPENVKHKDHQYRLYAIIVHVGKTPKSGHYMAYVRSSRGDLPEEDDDEKHDCQFNGCCKLNLRQTKRIDETEDNWFICNDNIITEVSQPDFATKVENEAERKTPYILLYARNDVFAA